MVRATGDDPVSASHSAAVLKTAVFAFHHARAIEPLGAGLERSRCCGGPRIRIYRPLVLLGISLFLYDFDF